MTLPTIDESHTAKGYTPAAQVPAVFGEPRTIQSITIHYWGATGQTHDGVVDFFCNGPGQTSAHFVASDGRVSCIVSPPDAAWHAGNAHGNATSIGIECHPEATDGDYQTVADLVAWLRTQYGDLPLFPHNHWTSTSCPGPWDLNRIDQLARGEDMALTDDDIARIRDAVLHTAFTRQGDGETGTVDEGAVIANFDSAVANIVKAVNAHIDAALKGIALTITDAQVQTLADKLTAVLPAADLALLKSKL